MPLLSRLAPRRIYNSLVLRVGKLRSKWISIEDLHAQRLAVVATTQNRSGARVENFLRTLSEQTLARSAYDIVIVDYGSSSDHLVALRGLCARYSASLIELPAEERLFNKSLCNNVGIRFCSEKASFVLCTDVDMIFDEFFLEAALRNSVHFHPAIVTCQLKRLPQDSIPVGMDVRQHFGMLSSLGKNAVGVGPCLCAPTEWWVRVRGFDERIPYGGEDTDLHLRAVRDGLKQIWISDLTEFLHQWHTPLIEEMAGQGAEVLRQWQGMLARHHELLVQDKSIVRNPDSWGKAEV